MPPAQFCVHRGARSGVSVKPRGVLAGAARSTNQGVGSHKSHGEWGDVTGREGSWPSLFLCRAPCGTAQRGLFTAGVAKSREPILNIPAVVTVLLVVLALIHVVRVYALSDDTDTLVVYTFGFVPARYDTGVLAEGVLPGGFGAEIWSFVTYSFLHANLAHLGFNAIWFAAFGSPLARRFGSARFLAFFAVTSAAGALAYLVTNPNELAPVIGASAAISGMMGGATRFAFEPGGSLHMWRGMIGDPDRIPAPRLGQVIRNPRVIAFLAVWFGLNLVFGIGAVSITGATEGQSVAWEAHVGGFIAGLLLFSFFDPIGPFIPGSEIQAQGHSPPTGQAP